MSTRTPTRLLSRSVSAVAHASYRHVVETLRRDLASSPLTTVDEVEVDRSRVGPSSLVSARRLVTRVEVLDAAGVRGCAAVVLDLVAPTLARTHTHSSLEGHHPGRALREYLSRDLLDRGVVIPAPSNEEVAALDELALRSVGVVREVNRLAGETPYGSVEWAVLRAVRYPEVGVVADVRAALAVLRSVDAGAPLAWALRRGDAARGTPP